MTTTKNERPLWLARLIQKSKDGDTEARHLLSKVKKRRGVVYLQNPESMIEFHLLIETSCHCSKETGCIIHPSSVLSIWVMRKRKISHPDEVPNSGNLN